MKIVVIIVKFVVCIGMICIVQENCSVYYDIVFWFWMVFTFVSLSVVFSVKLMCFFNILS